MANKTNQKGKVLSVDELTDLLEKSQAKNGGSKRKILATNLRQMKKGTKFGTGFIVKVMKKAGLGSPSGKRNNPEVLNIMEGLVKDGVVVEAEKDGKNHMWEIVDGK